MQQDTSARNEKARDDCSLLFHVIPFPFGTTPTALAGYESAFFVCALVVGAANLLGMIFIRPDEQAARLAELSAAR